MERTIAAIATPVGEGGIAVLRVSGEEAISVCDRIFQGKKLLKDAKTHTLSFGKIIKDGRVLDEVLVSVMRAPHSFTGEDVVEISCHGGICITRSILELLLANGAGLATPGEFTKRAFLNGKLDLSQAEAVIDLIQAETEAAASLSVNQLEGKLSAPIDVLRKKLLSLAAHLDAMADFPDEGIDELPLGEMEAEIEEVLAEFDLFLSKAEQGRMIRKGIQTVIVGKPNVGKSSLLNALSGTERALVTQQAGTTRDVIEEQVILGNVRLNVFDTAGIRNDAEQIEEMGIQKAKEYLDKADLVFFMLDVSRDFTKEDEDIARMLSGKKVIVLLNKTDLKDGEMSVEFLPDAPRIYLSAKEKTGIEALAETIEAMFSLGEITQKDDSAIINMRHKQALMDAKASLSAALFTLQSGLPFDLLSVDLRAAVSSLGEITGQTVSDEIVDEIFSRFCLGK